jgi:hypothetical protein
MKIEPHRIGYQIYLIPTIKITHDRMLNGAYEVIFIWFNFGLSLRFKEMEP